MTRHTQDEDLKQVVDGLPRPLAGTLSLCAAFFCGYAMAPIWLLPILAALFVMSEYVRLAQDRRRKNGRELPFWPAIARLTVTRGGLVLLLAAIGFGIASALG